MSQLLTYERGDLVEIEGQVGTVIEVVSRSRSRYLVLWRASRMTAECDGEDLRPAQIRTLEGWAAEAQRLRAENERLRRCLRNSLPKCGDCGGTGAVERDGIDTMCPTCHGGRVKRSS